jgi:hypothetical protein
MARMNRRASGFIRVRRESNAGQAVSQTRKAMIWFVLAALTALVSYWSFRGYLAAEFLIGFANSLYCGAPRSAASTVFEISMATVMGPTPPGTGVI